MKFISNQTNEKFFSVSSKLSLTNSGAHGKLSNYGLGHTSQSKYFDRFNLTSIARQAVGKNDVLDIFGVNKPELAEQDSQHQQNIQTLMPIPTSPFQIHVDALVSQVKFMGGLSRDFIYNRLDIDCKIAFTNNRLYILASGVISGWRNITSRNNMLPITAIGCIEEILIITGLYIGYNLTYRLFDYTFSEQCYRLVQMIGERNIVFTQLDYAYWRFLLMDHNSVRVNLELADRRTTNSSYFPKAELIHGNFINESPNMESAYDELVNFIKLVIGRPELDAYPESLLKKFLKSLFDISLLQELDPITSASLGVSPSGLEKIRSTMNRFRNQLGKGNPLRLLIDNNQATPNDWQSGFRIYEMSLAAGRITTIPASDVHNSTFNNADLFRCFPIASYYEARGEFNKFIVHKSVPQEGSCVFVGISYINTILSHIVLDRCALTSDEYVRHISSASTELFMGIPYLYNELGVDAFTWITGDKVSFTTGSGFTLERTDLTKTLPLSFSPYGQLVIGLPKAVSFSDNVFPVDRWSMANLASINIAGPKPSDKLNESGLNTPKIPSGNVARLSNVIGLEKLSQDQKIKVDQLMQQIKSSKSDTSNVSIQSNIGQAIDDSPSGLESNSGSDDVPPLPAPSLGCTKTSGKFQIPKSSLRLKFAGNSRPILNSNTRSRLTTLHSQSISEYSSMISKSNSWNMIKNHLDISGVSFERSYQMKDPKYYINTEIRGQPVLDRFSKLIRKAFDLIVYQPLSHDLIIDGYRMNFYSNGVGLQIVGNTTKLPSLNSMEIINQTISNEHDILINKKYDNIKSVSYFPHDREHVNRGYLYYINNHPLALSDDGIRSGVLVPGLSISKPKPIKLTGFLLENDIVTTDISIYKDIIYTDFINKYNQDTSTMISIPICNSGITVDTIYSWLVIRFINQIYNQQSLIRGYKRHFHSYDVEIDVYTIS